MKIWINLLFGLLYSLYSFLVSEVWMHRPLARSIFFHFTHARFLFAEDLKIIHVHLAESDDAENWTLLPNFSRYSGSVPDVITKGNKLYIYTPGKVKRYDYSSNQWESNPVNVSITDSIGNPVQYVDPSAYVDENGNL